MNINSPRPKLTVEVFLSAENIYSRWVHIKANLRIHCGQPAATSNNRGHRGIFNKQRQNNRIVSGISTKRIESQARIGQDGFWIQIGSYTFESEPVDNIEISTVIKAGDTLGDGSDIDVNQPNNLLLTEFERHRNRHYSGCFKSKTNFRGDQYLQISMALEA